MNLFYKIVLILFCCNVYFSNLIAQTNFENYDQIYGLDHQLYNGFVYKGNYGAYVKGEAFLYKDFQDGHLIMDHQIYENLSLNYDIYNQILVLKFQVVNGAQLMIEVPFFKLNSFQIKDHHFKLQQKPDSSFQVYQIIGNGNKSFWLTHEKKLEVASSSSSYEFEFTRDFINTYYMVDNQLLYIKNNKALLQTIDKDKQQQVKKWLRRNKTKMHKPDPNKLLQLYQYLEKL